MKGFSAMVKVSIDHTNNIQKRVCLLAVTNQPTVNVTSTRESVSHLLAPYGSSQQIVGIFNDDF